MRTPILCGLALTACSGETPITYAEDATTPDDDGPELPSLDGDVPWDSPVHLPPKFPCDCPSSIPQGGTPCGAEGLVCEFLSDAGDPMSSCKDRATCKAAQWVIKPGCARTWACPADIDAAAGQECGDAGTCSYGGLDCVCTNCWNDGPPLPWCDGPARWRCESSNTSSKCPPTRPLAGTACPADGVACWFGWCGTDKGRYCAGCVWTPYTQDCPISLRSAKKDIHYVTSGERERIAREALALKLATYTYRDPSDSRTHLGIILDDAPESFGSDMERGRVDLYGYASMALAALQQQQTEIDNLRRELDDLRRMLARTHQKS